MNVNTISEIGKQNNKKGKDLLLKKNKFRFHYFLYFETRLTCEPDNKDCKILTMPYDVSIHSLNFKEWLAENLSPQDIEADLQQKGLDEDSIIEIIREYKNQRNAKKQFKGFVMMAVGAFIGFLSCVLTLTEVYPQWYGFILYGLTFIGVTIVFIGLYFVFE